METPQPGEDQSQQPHADTGHRDTQATRSEPGILEGTTAPRRGRGRPSLVNKILGRTAQQGLGVGADTGQIKTAFESLQRDASVLAPFDRFTGRSRQVLVLAIDEARRFNHNYIGTEHLLLGLVREEDGIAAKALVGLGVSLDRVRGAIEFIIGRGDRAATGEVGLTPRAARSLTLSMDEARNMGHGFVGTEHILLGLLREGEGIAAGVLESFGITLERVRPRVGELLASGGRAVEPAGPRANVITCRLDDRDLDALDALVETGIRSTRSDAASWLIGAGIAAHQDLFERVYATVEEIRQLRIKAQVLATQVNASPPATIPHAATARATISTADAEHVDSCTTS